MAAAAVAKGEASSLLISRSLSPLSLGPVSLSLSLSALGLCVREGGEEEQQDTQQRGKKGGGPTRQCVFWACAAAGARQQ